MKKSLARGAAIASLAAAMLMPMAGIAEAAPSQQTTSTVAAYGGGGGDRDHRQHGRHHVRDDDRDHGDHRRCVRFGVGRLLDDILGDGFFGDGHRRHCRGHFGIWGYGPGLLGLLF